MIDADKDESESMSESSDGMSSWKKKNVQRLIFYELSFYHNSTSCCYSFFQKCNTAAQIGGIQIERYEKIHLTTTRENSIASNSSVIN